MKNPAHTARSNARRKRQITSREAGKVGHRYYVFYRSHQARRALDRPGGAGNPANSHAVNPYTPDTADHAAWDAGWKYAEMEMDETNMPVEGGTRT